MKKYKMRKIIIGVMMTTFLLFSVGAQAQGVRYGTIEKIKGKVEVRGVGASEWIQAQNGMVLHENDELRTDKNSHAQLLLDKEGSTAQLEIKETTRMRLNTLGLNPATSEKTTLLDVAIGRVMVHVEKLKGNSKFEINTPTSTMGVRGTKFEVVVKEKDKKEVKK